MNNITKFSTLALAAAMAFTGCIKETQPTTVVTSDAVAQSSTAVEAMVNAIPVAEALPYSVYGSGQNRGFDFGLPGIMCAGWLCGPRRHELCQRHFDGESGRDRLLRSS